MKSGSTCSMLASRGRNLRIFQSPIPIYNYNCGVRIGTLFRVRETIQRTDQE